MLDSFYLMLRWATDNVILLTLFVTAITLFVTAMLVIITLAYTLITKKMLRLASQPTVKIVIKDTTFHPKIPHDTVAYGEGDSLGDIRYAINIEFELVNIGNHPAQNIMLDAEVTFKTQTPFGVNTLPVHLPKSIGFLPSVSHGDIGKVKLNLAFDNFVAKEIIRDFFVSRKNWDGLPFLPTHEEIRDPRLWPSSRITARCIYSDIQGEEYISESQLFFHIWRNEKEKELEIYIFSLGEIEFVGVKKISRRYRKKYIKERRHLRYASFSGEEHKKRELMLLKAQKKN